MKKFKKLLPAILASVLVVSNAAPAFACTGVYVGNQVSENGSTYMGRSEDIGDLYGKIFSVAPARDIVEGEIYKDTYGFEMDYSKFSYPSRTYSYTYVKDTPAYGETMKDANGNFIGEAYGEAGQNEKGLSMSATVSTSYSSKVKAVDPLVRTGICEISLTSVLLGGAATAREAVDLLAAIIDEYGAGECNSLMFSDPNETWYFEIVSGYQYAAVKMPADKVSIQPNYMLLGVIDVEDTKNVVASENLVSLASENGFLVTDENGKIDVTKTYLGNHSSGSYSRYWQGLFYINEEAAIARGTTYNSENPLTLYLDPAEKLSTMDVLRLLAYRGEGTALDSNANSRVGAIGNNRQSECHIFETRQNMPTELAILQWQAMADAEFSIYVPYYSALVTETNELYHTEERPTKTSETNGQINMNFQIINNLCYNNRANCADAVKAYFAEYQESLIAQQSAVDSAMLKIYAKDKEAAKIAATGIGKDLAKQVSDASTAVLAELRAYLAGDQAEPFALSEETTSMMPKYSAIDYFELPYSDVAETDWFYDAAYFNYVKGLITGTDATTFAPAEILSRAQLASILYRMDGSPETAYTEKFSDVENNTWYTSAVLWAAEKNIVSGYENSDKFGPHDNVTREQMATMLLRYAKSKDPEINTTGDLSKFADASSVSEFATEAMQWAVENGIIYGKEEGTVLDPTNVSTRAEGAAIIQRYLEK